MESRNLEAGTVRFVRFKDRMRALLEPPRLFNSATKSCRWSSESAHASMTCEVDPMALPLTMARSRSDARPDAVETHTNAEGMAHLRVQPQRLLQPVMLSPMKRDYPDRPIIGAGAVIVSQGRALLVRRATQPLIFRGRFPEAFWNWAKSSTMARRALGGDAEVEPGAVCRCLTATSKDQQDSQPNTITS